MYPLVVQRICECDLVKLAEQNKIPGLWAPICPQRHYYLKDSVSAGFKAMRPGTCRDPSTMDQPHIVLEAQIQDWSSTSGS